MAAHSASVMSDGYRRSRSGRSAALLYSRLRHGAYAQDFIPGPLPRRSMGAPRADDGDVPEGEALAGMAQVVAQVAPSGPAMAQVLGQQHQPDETADGEQRVADLQSGRKGGRRRLPGSAEAGRAEGDGQQPDPRGAGRMATDDVGDGVGGWTPPAAARCRAGGSAVSTMSIMGKPRGGMPRARAGTRLAGGAGRGVVRFRQSCPGRRGSVPCPRASARRRPWRG
jgi:hypothetical protein